MLEKLPVLEPVITEATVTLKFPEVGGLLLYTTVLLHSLSLVISHSINVVLLHSMVHYVPVVFVYL